MDFFVYSRDAPGAEVLRAHSELLEEPWSYMDGFAALETPGREAAWPLLRDGAPALGAFPSIGLHDWGFGGRR
jgi:hypothetical protein